LEKEDDDYPQTRYPHSTAQGRPRRADYRDVHAAAAIGLTMVEIVGDEPPRARYLALIEATAARLAVYAEEFRHAAEEDTN